MARQAAAPAQLGYLEPASDNGPFTIAGIFGHAAPSPLVMTGGAGNDLDMGGHVYGVAPLSGVTTVDTGPGPMDPASHQPHFSNLLRPMHSEGFWVLLLVLAAVGLFSVGANARLGPIRFGGKVGK